MRNCGLFPLAFVAFLAAATPSALANVSGAQRCSVAKLKAAVKKAAGQGACQEKAIKNAVTVDSGCLAAAGTRFSLAFQEAEAHGGCLTTGDAGNVENQVDALGVDLVNALGSTGTTAKCNVDKMKAALKLTAGLVRCDEKAIDHSVPVDRTCLGRAADHPENLFGKAEFECPGAGSGPTNDMVTAVGAFVPHLGRALAPTSTLPCEPPLLRWAPVQSGDIGGLAADASGNVFAVNHGFSAVQKYDNDGNFLTIWGSNGSGPGQFSNPTLDAVDASGNVFVADGDALNDRIEKFDNSGTFLTAWGSMGSGTGQFDHPEGVAVDAGGHVFVVDTGNSRIEKFDNGGMFLTAWGSAGGGPGQFNFPLSSREGIAVDVNGNVYVVDTGNSRIQKFDNGGTFLTMWGSAGSGGGQFDSPTGLAVDANGSVIVTDTGNDRIERFDGSGTLLTTCGGTGFPGGFDVPRGITVDANGNIFVADIFHIAKFDDNP